MNPLKQLWLSVRSNTYFVCFEGGASGAVVNYAYDALTAGQVDLTLAGFKKLAAFALLGGITAVRLLNRPAPGTNPAAGK